MDRNIDLCRFTDGLDAITGKWKLQILIQIIQFKNIRFSDLLHKIPKITKKMLSKNLKELEDNDLIERISYPIIPPKVEYRLTEYGKTIIPIIDQLHYWGQEHRKHITEKWIQREKNENE